VVLFGGVKNLTENKMLKDRSRITLDYDQVCESSSTFAILFSVRHGGRKRPMIATTTGRYRCYKKLDDTLDVIKRIAVKGVFLPGRYISIKEIEGGNTI